MLKHIIEDVPVKTQAWMLGLALLFEVGLSDRAMAQVVPDQTLPVGERSQVSGASDAQIDGGAIRGRNLFHSFQQFSIPTGGSASFNNSANITNIITRVTGSNVSTIDGLLRANGTANLFLINPNGIVFGANARLELGGSFLASTAEGLKFANGFEFSATSPQTPPLLTISAPIGLQYGSRAGEVRSQGATLQVPNSQTLALAGGNVSIDGGQLLAPGGRVELAGVAAAGEVGLTQQGQEWRLSVPDGLARADVSIGNDAIVDVRSGGGGNIAITARNLLGTGSGTRIRAGIAEGLGTVEAQAGDIDLNTTEAINLDEMLISNAVVEGGTGNAGNINITTGTLFLTNGGRVRADTFGQGNAGNVRITARDAVSFNGATSDGSTSGAFSTVGDGGIGQGGNISITTGILSLTRGGVVFAATFGQGNAGNVAITARDRVFADGLDSNQFLSGVYNVVGSDGIGNGGNISITTGTLSITNGGGVNAGTFGQGNAGNITITASDAVSLDGSNGVTVSGVASQVLSEGIGQGGNISITTGIFSLTNGGQLSVVTFGQGNAGSITITSDSIQLSGTTADGEFVSGLFASTVSRGNGGNLSIDTGTLIVRDGAQVTSGAFSEGAGGNLTVKATDSVQVIGESADGRASSGLFTQTENRGNGGNLSIDTRNLIVRDGAQVSSGTRGSGAGGSLTVTAADSIQVIGAARSDQTPSLVTARARASGNAGNITLKTGQLLLEDGGQVSS
ncbi:MAG: filamentous hemagglutinin N-terminal domain-containing protein, partial [Leptolyngbya sp. Prado105]|nr:filamentous hemagglutinin N-terminal domain-containing protein [Leptolyngbya sp. Prado105]